MPRRKREVKDPEIRRQEILNTAMKLFTTQGYEETSMRDIAREVNVSLGLCYRYYDSKQMLFQAAMDTYIDKCCQHFLTILKNPNLDFFDKIEQLFSLVLQEDSIYEYHDFFHQPQNTALHEELSVRICQYMIPHILEKSQKYCQLHHLHIENLDYLIHFIIYGQIGLLSHPDMPNSEIINSLKRYFMILFKHEVISDT